MSELIVSDLQGQVVASPLVELFELEIDSSTTLYFHPGLDDDLTEIQFRDKDTPSTIRTYSALPMQISGLELNADGPQNRPTIIVANATSIFRDALGNITNEDLIGQKLTRRRTFKKYLYGESDDASPPVEFPINTFIIDRVSGESGIAVEFELASPFDVSGVTLPSRAVVARFCPWIYQGYFSSPSVGACTWPTDSLIEVPDGTGGVTSHKAYFTIDDEPIVPSTTTFGTYSALTNYSKSAYVTDGGKYYYSLIDNNLGNTPATSSNWKSVRIYTPWALTTAYSTDSSDPKSSDYVEYSNRIWRVTRSHTSTADLAPQALSSYWIRADVCGKTLESCKARFQFKPTDATATNSIPLADKDTKNVLPFGAFPGSNRFR